MMMIRFLLTYLFVAALFLLPANPAKAVIDAEQFNVLFSPIDPNYKPYSPEVFDDMKVEALQSKDAKAMYAIGMMYMDGVNTEQDYIQSREWLQKASNLGNTDAMVALAYLYTLDKRVTKFDKSNTRAKKWISMAEKEGNPRALYQLGIWYERGIVFQKDYDVAFEYFKKSAETGEVNAYVKLFLYYYFGRGTEVNVKKAIENLIKIKKETKSPQAKNFTISLLGQIYMELALLTNDPKLKFSLYELAWSHGNRMAVDAIADMYSEGVGVRKDYLEAQKWYQMAMDEFESIYSMEKLGILYLKGPGDIERDYKKAYAMFKRASELGGVGGAHYLGYMYYYGLGVEKNEELAQTWFDRSKKNAERAKNFGTLDNINYETDVQKILTRKN